MIFSLICVVIDRALPILFQQSQECTWRECGIKNFVIEPYTIIYRYPSDWLGEWSGGRWTYRTHTIVSFLLSGGSRAKEK